MYQRLHEKYHTLYLEDVLQGVILKPELMFDGIHPNDAGYAIIADRLVALFEDAEL
jgi:lysophospholipase L1-like esterase